MNLLGIFSIFKFSRKLRRIVMWLGIAIVALIIFTWDQSLTFWENLNLGSKLLVFVQSF